MANPFLGVRIPPDLNEAIAARVRETGQSKSAITIEALRGYLQRPAKRDRVESLEQRLAALESEVRRIAVEMQSCFNGASRETACDIAASGATPAE